MKMFQRRNLTVFIMFIVGILNFTNQFSIKNSLDAQPTCNNTKVVKQLTKAENIASIDCDISDIYCLCKYHPKYRDCVCLAYPRSVTCSTTYCYENKNSYECNPLYCEKSENLISSECFCKTNTNHISCKCKTNPYHKDCFCMKFPLSHLCNDRICRFNPNSLFCKCQYSPSDPICSPVYCFDNNKSPQCECIVTPVSDNCRCINEPSSCSRNLTLI